MSNTNEPSIGEVIDTLTNPIGYHAHLQTLDRLLQLLTNTVFVPACQIVRFYNCSSDREFDQDLYITGWAWIKKGEKEGQIRFRWEYLSQSASFGISINGCRILNISWSEWNRLVTATEETWRQIGIDMHFVSTIPRFSTVFPDLEVKMTELQ